MAKEVRQEFLREEIERLKAENEKLKNGILSDKEKTMLSFFYNLTDNIAVWASRGCKDNYEIVFWSKGAEKVYGHLEEEALGRNCVELFMTDEFKADACEDCDNIIENDDKFKNMIATDENARGERITVITNTFRIPDYERPNKFLQAEIGVDISSISHNLKDYRSVEEVDNKLAAMENLVEVIHSIDELATSQCPIEDFLKNILQSANKLFGEDIIALISYSNLSGKITLPNTVSIKNTEEKVVKLISRMNIEEPNFRPNAVKPSVIIPFFQQNTKNRIGFMYLEFPDNHKWNEIEEWTLNKFSHQIHFAIRFMVMANNK